MKIFLTLFLLIGCTTYNLAQDTTLTLTTRMFDSDQLINLSTRHGWVFKLGHNPAWATPTWTTADWIKRKPSDLSVRDTDRNGRAEGWFRLRVRLDSSFAGMSLGLTNRCWAAMDVYLDGRLVASLGNTGANGKPYAEHYPYTQPMSPIELTTGTDHVIALHVVDYVSPFSSKHLKGELENGTTKLISLFGSPPNQPLPDESKIVPIYHTIWFIVSFLLAMLFWLLAFQNLYERAVIRSLAIGQTLLMLGSLGLFTEVFRFPFVYEVVIYWLSNTLNYISVAFLPIILLRVLNYPSSLRLNSLIIGGTVVSSIISDLTSNALASFIAILLLFLFFFSLLIRARKRLKGAQWAIVGGASVAIAFALVFFILAVFGASSFNLLRFPLLTGFFLSTPLSFLVYIALRFKEILAEDRAKAAAIIQVTQEKNDLLATQNERLEQQVETRTAELKASQAQLIQKEKLASLGELTAGIAHEIQNPLNFVNNFSEVSTELVEELKEGPFQKLPDSEKEYAGEILGDLTSNLQKITHHGGRASAIVRGMLEHSRTESGEKRPTDLNALTDEYLNIAYHGFRAKDKSFNCELVTNFDPTVGQVDVAPQEIGRVLLNLYNNAFYAVSQRASQTSNVDYMPMVEVHTQRQSNRIIIRVSDNGTGIPESVKAKIFQPFFTTKPTGEGTGLGLSLSYDIVTKGHGGTLTVESTGAKGTVFAIILPV